MKGSWGTECFTVLENNWIDTKNKIKYWKLSRGIDEKMSAMV